MKRTTTEDMRVIAGSVVIAILCGFLAPNGAMSALYVIAALIGRDLLAWLLARAFTWWMRGRPGAGESRGSDGLTDAERDAMAQRYAETVARPRAAEQSTAARLVTEVRAGEDR